MDKEFTDKIENEILTSEILFSCLCAAETAIGKYAVLAEKWGICGNSIWYIFSGNKDYFVRVSKKIRGVLLLSCGGD